MSNEAKKPEENKMTVGDHIRARRARKSSDIAKEIGIQNLKEQEPIADAEKVVYMVNPHGLIFEVTKRHYIDRTRDTDTGKAFRLATKEERDNYIKLSNAINKRRAEETLAIADASQIGQYAGEARDTEGLVQSPFSPEGVILGKRYVQDGSKGWVEQFFKGQLNYQEVDNDLLNEEEKDDK